MKLISLTIDRLPGLSQQLRVEGFGPDMNFITGPNASGKTSLIRALNFLLNPQPNHDPKGLILKAQFDIQGEAWSVTRVGGEVTWHHQGQPASPPHLPATDIIHCHLIKIEDLLEFRGDEEHLANQLRIELDGGFDLISLKTQFEKQTQYRATAVKRHHQEAFEALSAIRTAHRQLKHQQDQLPELKRQLEEIKQSEQSHHQVQVALEALELQAQRRALETERDTMPAVLAQLQPEVLEQVDALSTQSHDIKTQWQDLQRNQEHHQHRLETTAMVEGAPDSSTLTRLKALVEEGVTLHQTLQQHEARLERVQAKAIDRAQILGVQPPTPQSMPELNLSPEDLNALLALARQIDRAHHAALPTATEPQGDSFSTPALMASLTLMALGGWGLWFDHPVVSGFSLIGLTTLAIRLLIKKPLVLRTSDPLDPPKAQLEQEAQTLADQLGIQPALLGEASAVVFNDAYRHYQEARQEMIELRAAINHQRTELSACIAGLKTLTAPWSELDNAGGSHMDMAAIRLEINQLIQRAETAHHARSELLRIERDQKHLEQRLETIESNQTKLYTKAGLEMGARSELMALLERKPKWEELTESRRQIQARLDDRLEQLSQTPHLLEHVQKNEETALEALQRTGVQHAQSKEAVLRQIAEIEKDIRDTAQGQTMARAIADLEEAQERLERTRQDAIEAQAGLFWLDITDAQSREAGGDRAFDQAQALFQTFTHHQWSLKLSERFYAIHTGDGQALGLDQLSTATRMHLLLAVRLARVIHAEDHHEALPVFIDEALTTSDPQRASAVMKNLEQWAKKESRQIIYMAASDYELQLWQHLMGQPTHAIELRPNEATTGEDQTHSIRFSSPVEVPRPENLTLEAYADRLDVGRLKAFSPAHCIPLLYVLGDRLDVLHSLMSVWRLTELGPFERWLRGPQASVQLSADEPLVYGRRVELTRRWWTLWHQGRVPPLDEAVLHEALDGGGLTELSLPGVLKVAREQDFDAHQLLDELEHKPIEMGQRQRRLGTPQWEKLRDFLSERHFITEDQPLGAEQRRTQAMSWLTEPLSSDEVLELQALIDRLEQGQPQD